MTVQGSRSLARRVRMAAPWVRHFRDLIAWQYETPNHLVDGRDRGYISHALFSRLWNLAARALTATTNLMLHLKHRGAPHRDGRTS